MTHGEDKLRLDQALVVRSLVTTRARARDLIQREEVMVNGVVTTKPALRVGPAAVLALRSGAANYVSRGALKLKAALDAFSLDPKGRVAMDVGASTGGFTEVLISRRARKVYAVDSGSGQLHASLRDNPAVISLESTDVRRLTQADIHEPIEAIVADVSFISLTKALPVPMGLAAPGGWLVALIKPQFEAGPEAVPRTGIVKDPAAHQRVVHDVRTWIGNQVGWRVLGVVESPIKGGDGNKEFLIGAVHDGP